MLKRSLIVAAAVLMVACNSGPSQTADNTVGGANIVSSAKSPMVKATTTFSLDWGKDAKAGQVAIADVISYGGPKVAITVPAGWQLIRDDSTSIHAAVALLACNPGQRSQHVDVDIQRAGRCAGRDPVARQCRVNHAGGYDQRQHRQWRHGDSQIGRDHRRWGSDPRLLCNRLPSRWAVSIVACRYHRRNKSGSDLERILDPRQLSESKRRHRGPGLQRRTDLQLGGGAGSYKAGHGDSVIIEGFSYRVS